MMVQRWPRASKVPITILLILPWPIVLISWNRNVIPHDGSYSSSSVSYWEIYGKYWMENTSDTRSMKSYIQEHDLYVPPDTESSLRKWLLMWQPSFKQVFDRLAKSKPAMDDPVLISLIGRVLIPPSQHKMYKISHEPPKTPQALAALDILKEKKNGFFIEAGAQDGESSSNTFYLESDYGWTGLLVEADPYFFQLLLGRNRRAHSLNACLSPQPYPVWMDFIESPGGQGRLNLNRSKEHSIKVPCFPLYSILIAMGVWHVDFFSLDVEGSEMPIIQNFPWGKINVSVVAVEYEEKGKDFGGVGTYSRYMKLQGYEVYKTLFYSNVKAHLHVNDLILTKKELQH